MEHRPGYKTTEFYLSLLATLIGALLASGIFNDADPSGHKVLQIAGMVASVLGAMGYTVSRGFVKANAPTVNVIGTLDDAQADALHKQIDPVSGRAS